MIGAIQIPAQDTVAISVPSGSEVELVTFQVACGNAAGASFYAKYVPKGGGEFYMTSKLFMPPQLSTWTFPNLPFRMQPGDTIHVSASDAANYDLIWAWRPVS